MFIICTIPLENTIIKISQTFLQKVSARGFTDHLTSENFNGLTNLFTSDSCKGLSNLLITDICKGLRNVLQNNAARVLQTF